MLNSNTNSIRQKMLPTGWKRATSMSTPPRVRRTSFPDSSQTNLIGGSVTFPAFVEPPSPTSYADSSRFKGGVPWSTAFLQLIFVVSYLVFLWLPLGTVVERTGSAPAMTATSPWYLYLSSRVALHGAVYLLVGIVGLYIFQKHKETQHQGYLRFYRSINMLRRLPIFTMSVVNVLLLSLWLLTSFKTYNVATMDIILRVLITVECLIVVPCFLRYVIRVQQHNASSPLPDAQQVMSSSFEPMYDDEEASSGERGGNGGGNGNGGRHQADVVKWQNLKIKDLQKQVLALVERNQNLERKQLVMARQALMAQANAHDSHGFGDVGRVVDVSVGVGVGVGVDENSALMSTARMRRQLEDSTKEQARLSSLLREEKRKHSRNKSALMVEREMNRESQRIIEELHRESDGGHTSTSS